MENRLLCPGVELTAIHDTRYKTNQISLSFLLPLSRKSAAANALLSQIITDACEKYPDLTQLNCHLAQLYGAAIFGDVRKIGEVQVITFTVAAIHDRFALAGEALSSECAELLIELLFHPALENGIFRKEDFERERRQLLEEIDGEFNDKRLFSSMRCQQLMFDGEIYGIPRYGSREDVEKLTPEQVTLAWKEMLRHARVKITLLGDMNDASVTAQFKKAFSQIARDQIAECSTYIKEEITAEREFIERYAVTQAKLVMGFRTSIAEPSENTMAMRFTAALLGGTAHSKLFLNVREKKSLCYYCSARYYRNKGVMMIESGILEKNKEETQKEILLQLEEMKQGKITEEEMEATRLSLVNAMRTISDSQYSLENWYLLQTFDRELLTPEQAIEKVNCVTKEDVIDCAKTLWLDTIYLLTGKETTKEAET